MNERETAKKGVALAALVISSNQVCDRSKLDAMELEMLNLMIDAARGILNDSCEYDPEQTDRFIG